MSEIIRIPNIENYTQENINGELVLQLKSIYITEDELNRTILNSSKILDCIVKNGEDIVSNKTKYRSILDDIWFSMRAQKILQTTKFNMKLTKENGLYGYKWCPRLNLSIQNKDANYTIKEIINMVKVNNYSIQITIKLETDKIIKFKLNI